MRVAAGASGQTHGAILRVWTHACGVCVFRHGMWAKAMAKAMAKEKAYG